MLKVDEPTTFCRFGDRNLKDLVKSKLVDYDTSIPKIVGFTRLEAKGYGDQIVREY